MLKTKNIRSSSGGALSLELLIAIFFFTLALAGLVGLASFLLGATALSEKRVVAESLASGQLEMLRNFRDGTNWSVDGLGVFNSGEPYHLEKTMDNPPEWSLVQGQESLVGFYREVIFSDVFRDADDNLVGSYGVLDPGTKKVTVRVAWSERTRQHQVSFDTYLTNWK